MSGVKKNDFNTDELVNFKDHDALTKRVLALEEKFGNNEKIGETLKTASSKITTIKEMVIDILIESLTHNVQVKSKFSALIKASDNDYKAEFMRRFGKTSLWVISIIITAVVTTLIQKYISH